MKVCMIVPGGVDRSGTHRVMPRLLWLIERLAREHDLHVFALRQEPRPATYRLLGATVHNIGARPRRVRALGAIMREHMRSPFGVIHAFWAFPQGVIAAAASRALNVPVLLHIIGGDLADLPAIDYGLLRTRRGRMWLAAATAAATRITVTGGAMVRRAAELGIDAQRVPHGIALDQWPLAEPRRSPEKFGAPARLLSVGSINRVKDQMNAVQAFALVRRELDAQLDIVGVDTMDGAVQAEAARLGVADAVHFHGFVPHHELRRFFERANALVVSSRYESGPMAALEAAIAGVPVIGADVGHLREWASDAAAVVPIGDPARLARAIVDVLRDDERRLSLARNAQRRALAEDADAAAKAANTSYEELAVVASGRTSDSVVRPSFTSRSASAARVIIPSDTA